MIKWKYLYFCFISGENRDKNEYPEKVLIPNFELKVVHDPFFLTDVTVNLVNKHTLFIDATFQTEIEISMTLSVKAKQTVLKGNFHSKPCNLC